MASHSSANQPTLLLLGHGSSKHPDSSRSVRMHVDLLRVSDRFADVFCAFLKEEPRIESVIADVLADPPAELVIVPDFLASGYFTQQVIPKLIGLDSLPNSVRYCQPVGTHPMMASLLVESARAAIGDWAEDEVSLLIIGHGSTKNTQSKLTLLEHVESIQKTTSFAQIQDLWLEEEPWLSDWKTVVSEKKVIIVPFLLSDGQHGGWDIPVALGILNDGERSECKTPDLVRNTSVDTDASSHVPVTHKIDRIELRLTSAIGTSARFIDVIVETFGG